jgi:hypothetical protein
MYDDQKPRLHEPEEFDEVDDAGVVILNDADDRFVVYDLPEVYEAPTTGELLSMWAVMLVAAVGGAALLGGLFRVFRFVAGF